MYLKEGDAIEKSVNASMYIIFPGNNISGEW